LEINDAVVGAESRREREVMEKRRIGLAVRDSAHGVGVRPDIFDRHIFSKAAKFVDGDTRREAVIDEDEL